MTPTALAIALATALTAGALIEITAGVSSVAFRGAQVAWAICLTLAAVERLLQRSEDARRRPRPRLLLLAAAVWICVGLVRTLMPGGDGLAARYYPNTMWAGAPASTTTGRPPRTREMTRAWTGSVPGSFTATWEGYLTVTEGGSYRMSTTSDDASWLYVDERLIVDNGGTHAPTAQSGDVRLTRGTHKVRLEYMELGGGHFLDWSWARSGEAPRPVPAWTLSSRAVSRGQALAARAADLLMAALGVALTVVGGLHASRRIAPPLGGVVAQLLTRASARYASPAALACSLAVYAALILMPQSGWDLWHISVETTRLLGTATAAALVRFDAFQSNVNTPHAGERQAVPERVLTMVEILDRRHLQHYALSEGLTSNGWVFQQMVASAWPRTLEPRAAHRFLLVSEAVPPECRPLEQRNEVSLVACP